MGLKILRDKDFISGLFLIIFATWIYLETIKIPAAEKLILMRATFFPYVISIGLFIAGFILVGLPVYRNKIDPIVLGSKPGDILILLIFLALIFLYFYGIKILGYLIGTFSYLLISMFLLKVQNKLYALLLSAGVTLVIYLIFRGFLKVPLPAGILNL
ncbi:MAG: putative tricarboxylic transport rane protein [Clostridia bacterium]|nr:putative tricarboxylic transport rane protein [Clostridia bacterium]